MVAKATFVDLPPNLNLANINKQGELPCGDAAEDESAQARVPLSKDPPANSQYVSPCLSWIRALENTGLYTITSCGKVNTNQSGTVSTPIPDSLCSLLH